MDEKVPDDIDVRDPELGDSTNVDDDVPPIEDTMAQVLGDSFDDDVVSVVPRDVGDDTWPDPTLELWMKTFARIADIDYPNHGIFEVWRDWRITGLNDIYLMDVDQYHACGAPVTDAEAVRGRRRVWT